MKPPKYSATATSTPESELVGCPLPAAVVLVMMCLRTVLAIAFKLAMEISDITVPALRGRKR